MAALSLADLQSMRDALIRQRAAGILSCRDASGEMVVYSSLESMGKTIADLEARIAELQTGGRPNVIRFNSSKFGE